ncbi:hypothetical protein EN836_24440 [Mesorhizobium sp. M1C.F.Ca.ET.193.01.1.1]|uniref:hypothetical protein n=1 Tax=unclassified Mesorhizobium TaxID=325217 RepID=UPI000FD24112|nr:MULTISPECIES: hypothetical protein [unclassified Mesorhizobium]TGS95007.1 hypothetical protein EN820_44685 [bacterium M00.F.Ca.ET.177.01.1.1]RWG91436.1 MAG: hypothetical protein EOQ70_00070 [Mesorhizobium sp.]RWK22573.1 MAG: hypothetical protein EOR41_00260 [Mesorhizobium sp.]TGQ51346.1 hypothetical protein EN853_24430 [Mesorhizobium sp. M1C.F.Ca.ET.210.01.1.1]TGQ67136.1 hypothetical protein EN855_024440 [Mesorhizobium sp. M1C.F.Ca.ET.212.01.1.1]
MSKALGTFALVTLLSALLMALSLAVARHGYPYGAFGMKRLDGIAEAGSFLPIAAIYFFSALLMMILPIRAAGVVLTHAADAIFWATIVLFATIVGSLLARWAFGQSGVLSALLNWRFLFAVAIVAAHLTMNELRRNILLRSLFFVIFAAATLACLFWSFSV